MGIVVIICWVVAHCILRIRVYPWCVVCPLPKNSQPHACSFSSSLSSHLPSSSFPFFYLIYLIFW